MPSSAFEKKESDATCGARSTGMNLCHGFSEDEGRLAITIDNWDSTLVRNRMSRPAVNSSKNSHFRLLHRTPEFDKLPKCIS